MLDKPTRHPKLSHELAKIHTPQHSYVCTHLGDIQAVPLPRLSQDIYSGLLVYMKTGDLWKTVQKFLQQQTACPSTNGSWWFVLWEENKSFDLDETEQLWNETISSSFYVTSLCGTNLLKDFPGCLIPIFTLCEHWTWIWWALVVGQWWLTLRFSNWSWFWGVHMTFLI